MKLALRRGSAAAILWACLAWQLGDCSGVRAETNWLGHSVESVVDSVNRTYARVTSARGRISRTVEAGELVERFEGRFAARRPDHLFVELAGEDTQVLTYDGEYLHVYFPLQKRGLRRAAADLNPLERLTVGPAPFFGNVLPLLERGFSCDVADTVGGDLILKAIPDTPVLFNFILVAVDPSTWTVRAVEHFDRDNALVSQTRFLEFEAAGDSLFIPVETVSASLGKGGLFQETTRLSRVELNVSIADEVFAVRAGEGVVWEELAEQ